jgi:hypothetical protein
MTTARSTSSPAASSRSVKKEKDRSKNTKKEALGEKKQIKVSTAEIDELFKKPSKSSPAPPTAVSKTTVPRRDAPLVSQTVDDFDVRGDKKKVRPLTADGLPIFTAEEMAIGRGGDSPDCPFDCNCCF